MTATDRRKWSIITRHTRKYSRVFFGGRGWRGGRKGGGSRWGGGGGGLFALTDRKTQCQFTFNKCPRNIQLCFAFEKLICVSLAAIFTLAPHQPPSPPPPPPPRPPFFFLPKQTCTSSHGSAAASRPERESESCVRCVNKRLARRRRAD